MSSRLFVWLFLVLISARVQGEDFLDPAVAFQPSARALDAHTVEVLFSIAKGYYLYRDKFRFAAEPPSIQIETAQLPPGQEKHDDTFGKVEVYYGEVRISIPVRGSRSETVPLTLKITSQGCAEAGICYPPQQQRVSVQLPAPATKAATPPPEKNQSTDESGRIARLFKNSGGWLLISSFFGFGLLLSLTPCIFPMIPILSSIIVGAGGSGHRVSHARGFFLSLAYVLGMAVSYAAAGVIAGLTGTLLSTALQNAWVLGGFSIVFVILSLSMFGFYELQLPTFLQSKVSVEASRLKGGSLTAVAAMGALSAIIVGPCVAAPLAGALLYIGQTGDALMGGTALFALALGMGAPLLAVGVSAGSLLPRSGPWMESIKKSFGVILLATALWLVSPVIPIVAQMIAWSLLLIVPAIYLHALDPLPTHARGWQRFWKGIGIVMLILGAAMLVGALSGSRDPLQPLSGLRAGNAATVDRATLRFVRVHSLADLESRLHSPDQPVLLDFYADWCVSCKEMERFTFSDPRVHAELAGWTLLQADVTANERDDQILLQRFDLYGPPGIVFFDRRGKEIHGVRVVGFQSVDDFLALLSRLRQTTT